MPDPRLAGSAAFVARRSNAVLLLILLGAGISSTLHAIARPFWYDEICTVIVCRLPSAQAVWNALARAADTNPPVFYYLARLGRQLVGDEHLGYRLPAILGLLAIVACIYAILSRRVDRLSALLGATFVLCTTLTVHGFEARPYALMIACISAAILAWQRVEDSRLYLFALAAALAAAASLHYYAILIWPAFGLAEASVWLLGRRFRAGVWTAFVVGATPLLFMGKFLFELRHAYGQHNWAHPNLNLVFSSYNRMSGFGGDWGCTFVAGVAILFVCRYFVKPLAAGTAEGQEREASLFARAESILTLVLLCFPVLAVAVAMAAHGGMSARYMLVAMVGTALAVGHLAARLSGGVKMLLLFLMLINYGISTSREDMQGLRHGSLLDARTAAAGAVSTIRALTHEPGLPIVISAGYQYLPMAYYTPPELRRNLYALTDAPAAIQYTGSDSIDLALLILARYFPLQVPDYREFASQNREFLLVTSGGYWDWWAGRLLHDGQTLVLVATYGDMQVFKVTLKP